MSILGLPVPAGELTFALVLLFLTCAGILTAALTGLLHPRSILGPDRIDPDRAAGWPVLVLLLITTLAWLGSQLLLAAYKQSTHPNFKLSDLTPADFAFLSTIPGLVATAAFLITFRFFPAPQRPRLGLSLSALPAGLRKGFSSILLILPVVLLVSVLTEWFYRLIGFQHPAEHELLRAMKDSSNPIIRWLLITGAVLIAPITEELLFRGLFQTLLVWAYNNLARSKSSDPLPPSRLIAGRWLAILVSSIIFASIHDKWSIPPIFVLALCLGFTYERTGNLYANITVHSLFNAFQTFFFLSHFY